MAIEIREVKNLHDLKTFIRFPANLYKNNPYYVPPMFADDMNTLRSDKNAAFAEAKARYFMAYKDGKLAGRVAAIVVSKEEKKFGKKLMRFGWLDFIEDPEVAKALMGAVEGWAKELGMVGVHGPLGFTDLDREGMLVEGFEDIATMATNYNYPYYPKYLESLGYAKEWDWLEYVMTLPDKSPEKVEKAAELIIKRYNLHMFKGTKKDLVKIAPQIFDVLEEAYRHLYGVVPLSQEQVQGYIDQYITFADPVFVPVVLDENDKVIAFGITFPSFSKALQKNRGRLFPFGFIPMLQSMKNNEMADLYLVGVRDEYLGKGINALLMKQIFDVFKSKGFKYIDSNLNLEDNNDVQLMWKYYENRQSKRHRCFIKPLA